MTEKVQSYCWYNFLLIAAELFTSFGNCTLGEVRLVGGGNNTLGRVEVCINNAWGSVCNSRFGTNEAKVICHQLGFSNTGNALAQLYIGSCVINVFNVS